MVETIGAQLRKAREARGLDLEDAAHATNIRASRLADLENDIYSNFPNLAYARGFLTIYGRYLDVDIRPCLGNFGDTNSFGLDDYQYLREEPLAQFKVIRRQGPLFGTANKKGKSKWKKAAPLALCVSLLVLGVFVWYAVVSVKRLGSLDKLVAQQPGASEPAPEIVPDPSPEPAKPAQAQGQDQNPSSETLASQLATGSAGGGGFTGEQNAQNVNSQNPILAGNPNSNPNPNPNANPQSPQETSADGVRVAKALPVLVSNVTTEANDDPSLANATPPPASQSKPNLNPTAPVAPINQPVAAAVPSSTPQLQNNIAPDEFSKVRKAIPVVAPNPNAPLRELTIKPLKKTYLTIELNDPATKPVFEDWVDPEHPPISFRANRFYVHVLDKNAVEIAKDGVAQPQEETDLTFE